MTCLLGTGISNGVFYVKIPGMHVVTTTWYRYHMEHGERIEYIRFVIYLSWEFQSISLTSREQILTRSHSSLSLSLSLIQYNSLTDDDHQHKVIWHDYHVILLRVCISFCVCLCLLLDNDKFVSQHEYFSLKKKSMLRLLHVVRPRHDVNISV